MHLPNLLPLASSYVALPNGSTAAGNSAAATPFWWAVVFMAALLLTTMLVCAWLVWRVRALVRVVREINDKQSADVTVPGPIGFLRFKMRTMLIVFTVVAIALGLFAKEFSRARRQGEIVERLEMTDAFDSYGGSYYRLGMLGDSYLAGLICDWVHPHFGCRLTHLNLDFQNDYGPIALPLDEASLSYVAELRDLEALRIAYGSLNENNVKSLSRLTKLKTLSLVGCRVPPELLFSELAKLPQLEALELADCRLVDGDLPAVCQLINVTTLSLARNELTDAGLKLLSEHAALEELSLSGNPITADGLIYLLPLEQLVSLDLSLTNMSEDSAAFLIEFPRLRFVNLTDCRGIGRQDTRELKILEENPRLEVEWNQRESDFGSWSFYDNRPSGPALFNSSSGGFISPSPPPANGGLGGGGGFGGGGAF